MLRHYWRWGGNPWRWWRCAALLIDVGKMLRHSLDVAALFGGEATISVQSIGRVGYDSATADVTRKPESTDGLRVDPGRVRLGLDSVNSAESSPTRVDSAPVNRLGLPSRIGSGRVGYDSAESYPTRPIP